MGRERNGAVKSGVMHACDTCGKEHYVYRCKIGKNRFCSKACFDAAQTTRERRIISCECCGEKFTTPQDHGKWPKFCSVACRDNGAIKPEWKQCASCESQFLATRSSHTTGDGLRIYCSKKCADEGLKRGVLKTCVNCGIEFYMNPAHVRQRREEGCCSKECQYEFYVRERNQGWKGGRYFDTTTGMTRVHQPRPGRISPYVAEHRLIAGKAVGKILEPYEVVIHINNVKTDNRPENLFICGTMSEYAKRRSGSLPWPSKSNLHSYEQERHQ